MQTVNFSQLNYSSVPQHETQARQNWYKSIEGMTDAVGKTVQGIDAAEEEDEKRRIEEEQRRLAEEWRQKEYSNRRWRQEVEDQRYKEQQKIEADKRLEERNALMAAKEGLSKIPSPDKLSFMYGPQAAAAYFSMEHAPTYADFMNAQKDLNAAIYQKQMLREQIRQSTANEKRTYADERPNKITRATLSNLTDKRIDISSGYLPTSRKEAQRWLAEVNAALMAQNSITQDGVNEHSDFSSKITSSLYTLQRRLQEFLGQTPNGY